MKTIISNLPMFKTLKPQRYRTDTGNEAALYPQAVKFPVSAMLPQVLAPKDIVKLLLLVTEGGDNAGANHAEEFFEELKLIATGSGAKITEPVIINTPFSLGKDNAEKLFKKIIGEIEQNTEIFADVTFGPKSLPVTLFCALNFAEKFFNAKIRNIVYGRVEFKDNIINESIPPVLYDITHLYFLNQLTDVMKAPNGKAALAQVDRFFAL